MFKKISNKTANSFIKMGYSICKIKNILIIKKYNKSKWFIKELFELLVGFSTNAFCVIIFPFVFIYTLFDFLPKIRIIDINIDKERQKVEDKANKELQERFKK